jgi:hypothetical protein
MHLLHSPLICLKNRRTSLFLGGGNILKVVVGFFIIKKSQQELLKKLKAAPQTHNPLFFAQKTNPLI